MPTKKVKRTPLSRERILQEALRAADEEGIEALSMRGLAQRLGVEAMSLYHHVANKEEILDGLVELVAAEIEPPEMGCGWREAMRTRALSAHAAFMRHPWAPMLFVSRVNVGPVMLRYVDATIGCLRAAGFSYPMVDHAWNTLDAYIYGFTMQKRNFPMRPEDFATAAAQFLPRLPVEKYPHLRGMSLEIITGRHDGINHIELGLDLLLDGLERLRSGVDKTRVD